MAPLGQLRVALNLTIADGRIVAIEAIAVAARLERFDLAALDA